MSENSWFWVRGGAWSFDSGELILEGALKRSQRGRGRVLPAAELPTRAQRRRRRRANEARSRARYELQRPNDNWEREWGRPLGLTRYALDRAIQEGALQAALAFADARPKDQERQRASDDLMADVVPRLFAFLQGFGPLEELPGVTTGSQTTAVGRIDVFAFWDSLEALGVAYKGATSLSRSHPQHGLLREFILKASTPVLQHARVEPRLDRLSGNLSLDVVPRTLEGALWLRILRVARARQDDRCPCGIYFEQPPGRRRPFRYCEQHRSRSDRRRLSRRLGEPSLFESE